MDKLELKMKIILCYNDFLISRLGVPKQFFDETNKIIKQSYEDKNSKVLESALNDIKHQIKYMSLENLIEFNKILNSNFELNTEILKNELKKKVDKILKRGSIFNDDEYRFLLEEKENFDHDINIIEKINSLLINYKK